MTGLAARCVGFGGSGVATSVAGFRRVAIGSLLASASLYLASPYVALWSMDRAWEHRDVAGLDRALDWSQVRAGLKQGLAESDLAQSRTAVDDLPGFGQSFAKSVVSSAIDKDVTPRGLATLLHDRATGPGAVRMAGFFTGSAQFEASFRHPGSSATQITLRIEQWRWKVTRLSLP